MQIIAVLIYMAYIYGAAWVLAMAQILQPENVNMAVGVFGLTLVILSILPPVRFLHSRYALFQVAGFTGFKSPNLTAKEELLSIWSDVVQSCGYDPKRFRVIVYPSKPLAWPHTTDNVLLLPDGFLLWARTRDGKAILVHEMGHLINDRKHTFIGLFYGGYKLALMPIWLLSFVWQIAAHMPLMNLIAIPISYGIRGLDYVLANGCTYVHKQSQWRAEYRADQFAAAHGFGKSMISALTQHGDGQDEHGSFTHPPSRERVRRLQNTV